MKSVKRRFLCFALLGVVSVVHATAQDRVVTNDRVAVLPLWYDEELSTGEALSATVQTTIQFMLRYLPNYELIETELYPDGQSALPAYMDENHLDNVIYGRLNQKDGLYTASLVLYSREQDQIMAMRQQSTESLMDIFDMADSLSIDILEAYLDRPLVFGSMAFKPNDPELKRFQVFINGSDAGVNLPPLARFLAGDYQIRVEELYADGRTRVVFDELVTLNEAESRVISFDRYPYADVKVLARGPKQPFTLRSGAFEIVADHGRLIELPAGSHEITVTQPDYQGEPYVVDQVSLDVELEEVYTLEVETERIGRGFQFVPAPEPGAETGEYEIYLDGELLEADQIDVLPQGRHEIEIHQILSPGETGERVVVYHKPLRNKAEENREVSFPLFADKAAWEEYQRNGIPDFSAVIQGFDGSLVQAGLRWEGLNRRLGISLLGGAALYEEEVNPSLKIKLHWLPLKGGSVLSPEAGMALRFDLVQGSPVFAVSPQLGITWNTGLPVLSSVFFENDLLYTIGEPLMFVYYFTVGVRLF